MNRYFAAVAIGIALTAPSFAKPISLADFPLRMQIYHHQIHKHHFRHFADSVSGTGQANIFEHHEARAVDFFYECPASFMDSAGPRTYPARWKIADIEVEILVGDVHHPERDWTCDLHVKEEPFAYKKLPNGTLSTMPVDDYKHWMETQHFDPESAGDDALQ